MPRLFHAAILSVLGAAGCGAATPASGTMTIPALDASPPPPDAGTPTIDAGSDAAPVATTLLPKPGEEPPAPNTSEERARLFGVVEVRGGILVLVASGGTRSEAHYTVTGAMAPALRQRVGQRVKVSGHVVRGDNSLTIDVKTFEAAPEP